MNFEGYNTKVNTIKVPSDGEEWVERRTNDREMRNGSRDILGADFLRSLRLKGKMPEVFRQKFSKSSFIKLQDQMKSTAGSSPYLFRMLIVQYFGSLTPDQKKKFIKKVGYDENGPKEAFKEMPANILVRAIFGGSGDDEDYIYNLEVAIHVQKQYANGNLKLSQLDLIPLLENHEKEILDKEEYLGEKIEQYREKIRDLLKKAIQAGHLPVKFEVAMERLDLVNFEIIDGLVASLEEKWGDFKSKHHLIRIASDVPSNKIWAVFVHEIMHAISGQIEIEEIEIEPEEDYPEFNWREITKIGTMFRGSLNLRWLNEALTEDITYTLIQHNGWAYKKEQKLLELLIKNGVPKDLLYAVYFENFDTTKPAGEHKLPKTKELFTLTNQIFGQRFLLDLDFFLQDHSVEEAISQWEKLGDSFPQFIADEVGDF